MIDYSEVTIENIVVHHIGSRAEGGPVKYSKSSLRLYDEETVGEVLRTYFFRPFKSEAYFNFTDENEEPENNQMFQWVAAVFDSPDKLYDTSIEVAGHLHENSNHPKIRSGEFYMAYFSNVVVDGEVTDAIGIFKSENKDTFLKVYLKDQTFELGAEEGINIRKLDKGCLVFNTEREAGFKVCMIDNINKGQEARFWKDDFLGLMPREDNYYFTRNYLNLCKDFVTDVYNEDHDVPRPDQIDMLNRSIDFFDKNNNFKKDDFEQQVIRQPEVIEAFNDYRQDFENEKEVPLNDNFDISKSAVKTEKKHFKSVLKLDKNFHVYVHGKRDYIERGFDRDKGMNYYKLYYDVEH
ncbi:MAG: nucleoid-associated protein [Marinilabiliaceae bacterium]